MGSTPQRLMAIPLALGIALGAGLLLLLLLNRLCHILATRQELARCSNHLMALQTLYLQVRHTTESTHARIAITEAEQALQWERTREQLLVPLERVTDKLEAAVAVQEARAGTLTEMTQRLDRVKPR